MSRMCGLLLLRAAVIIALASVVTTIIYFTPVPGSYHLSCDRQCHELDFPMICRFKLVVEAYCPANLTSCADSAGFFSSPLVANRMIPGPTIKVCENDIVVVDLVNMAMGQSLALHWGGQSQRHDPYMDGVPQLTQCPVNALNTFQYKFRATGVGTHLWSATGSPFAGAVFGPLVVKQSGTRDPNRSLYDEDQHVFAFSVFRGAILVNGEAVHEVTAPLVTGKRYRLRLLYSGSGEPGGLGSGPLVVELRHSDMLLVTLDGHPVRPRMVRSVTLRPGERADMVVKAGEPSDRNHAYFLEGRAPGAPAAARAIMQLGEPSLQQDNKGNGVLTASPSENTPDIFVGEAVNVESSLRMEGLEQIPDRLGQEDVDVRLYLPFRNDHNKDSPPGFCNISLVLPSAPLLTQLEDAEASTESGTGCPSAPLCWGQAQPAACPGPGSAAPAGAPGQHSPCIATHIIRVPLDSSVEMILVDQGEAERESVFHLHGNSFWVVGEAAGPAPRGSWQELEAVDRQGAGHQGLVRRTLDRPVQKDVVAVQRGGLVALRFLADNPGYWLLREQGFYQRSAGLGVILQVGEPQDLPPPPDRFPRCGSFSGPEFFLI